MHIELLDAEPTDAVLDGLAGLLVDCVRGGASVGFLADLTGDEARSWWRGALADPDSLTWVATDGDGDVVGCVRLLLAGMPNQPHRADVSKLLVHRRARGRGGSSALMLALEDAARSLGRPLLVLDTESGSHAEQVYAGWGWRRVGQIPGYALTPDGEPSGTTIFFKHL